MFDRYAITRRAARIPNYRLEVMADVTRHLPEGADDEAVLSFARFPPATAERRIDEELERLRSHGWEAEWKVHDFDQPEDLRSRLQAHGLTLHHAEALMVLEVDDARIQPSARRDVVVEAASGSTLDEIAQFQEEVWQCRLPWLVGALHAMTEASYGSCAVFCARVGGRVVGSGWIDFHGDSQFAQLSGGAVAEQYRGRGILFAAIRASHRGGKGARRPLHCRRRRPDEPTDPRAQGVQLRLRHLSDAHTPLR